MEENELQELLIDTQKEYTRSNKFKDKMIVLLIVLMFLEAAIGYCGFVWYDSGCRVYLRPCRRCYKRNQESKQDVRTA